MSDISKIKLPNGDVYNLKDNNALHNDDAYVQDVQINSSSIINNGIANIPRATGADYGVAKMATDSVVKAGTDYYSFLTPMRNHISTFYGLAKAAGDTTQSQSNNTVGTYTNEAKGAIQHMIGTDSAIAPYEADSTADRSYEVGNTFMMDGKLYKVTATITQGGVITPNGNCVETCIDNTYVKDVQIKGSSIISNGTANIPEMSETVAGVVKRGSGLYINSNGQLCSNIGTATTIKQGTASSAIAPISLQGNTAFYGLAKAAGDTTQSASSNAVGTYTTKAKTAIQTMLNVPDTSEVVNDVQINSTSIISNGVADIPLASTTTVGAVKLGDTMSITNSGAINFRAVGASEVKAGTTYQRALSPERQHASVFYGLTKAAGVDMKNSNNAIGVYTDEAKSAINSMLSAPEIISGTTPSIEAKANIQYICGECSTLNITIPANGIVDIIFQSGSTPTVLTITPPTGMTIKWPGWFNPNQLEANYTYEINILNGVYGVVMLWA